ncbi:MAG: SpoIIE family protein phosphatase [Bdellovibrionaceae bacterium]|nr:SpoIIE family protein phosphatase [Pseudobdellovibrionaceae bacterium]MBX3033417.1 SpoIIE family protein phosphatase [Pseudobdellovibrionaceae bacterium]
MSLRLKILCVLLALPTLALGLLLYLLTQTFEEDKSTYLYEYQRVALDSIALNLEDAFEVLVQRKESLPLLMRQTAARGPIEILANQTGQPINEDGAKQLLARTCDPRHSFLWWPFQKGQSFFVHCRYLDGVTWVMGIPGEIITANLTDQDLSSIFLVTQDGWIVLSDDIRFAGKRVDKAFPGLDFKSLAAYKEPTGRLQANFEGKGPSLLSYRKMQKFPLILVAATPESATRQAAIPFLVRGVLILLSLLVLTGFLGVIFSGTLTKRLFELLAAFRRVEQGDWELKIPEKGHDEVTQLTRGFNHMTAQLQRLLLERAEKSKIEHEMQMAATLQSRFFPSNIWVDGDNSIYGYYEPAAQCGGDWWFHDRTRERIIFCIADATGHGMSSALVTAAARAAFATQKEKFHNPALLMKSMNEAIYQTTAGEIQMTCFIGSFDLRSRVLTYCNASHEAPVLLPMGQALKKEDLVLLLERHGLRLGQNPDSVYTESSIQVEAGPKTLVLYSDGLLDVQTPEGKSLGEGRMLRLIIKTSKDSADTEAFFSKMQEELQAYRGGSPLVDDLSYLFFGLK